MGSITRYNPVPVFISALLGLALIFSAGCGGSSDDKDKDTSDGSNSYSGSSTLTGTVSLSGLSSEDSTLLSTTASGTSAKRISAAGDAVVKLYVLDDNGSLKDTQLTCEIAADDTYSCPNIADDQEYIVRYIKDLGNGKILDLKSSASVGAGESTPAAVPVNPITTMITAAIMDAVTEAITGIVSDEDLIRQIIASVKTAVETTVTQLIKDGVIEVPSLVQEGSIDDFVEQENEGLTNVSGAVLTDDGVTGSLDAAKSTVKGTVLANLNNREKIRMIFEQMMQDGGAPGWMTDFIGDKWDSVDSTHTFAWLSTMMAESLEVRTEELQWMGIDPSESWVSTMATDIQSAIESGLESAGTGSALAGAIEAIGKYHTIKAQTTKTEADLEFLADFPSVIGELFPQSYLDTISSTGLQTQFQNTGQITAYLIYLMDVYARETAIPIADTAFNANNVQLYGDMKENIHLVDFSPEELFLDLGFVDVASDYYGLYFDGWIEIRSEQYWEMDDTTGMGTQSNILRLETGMENPEWFMSCDAGLSSDDITAKLIYPNTAGATTTVDMDVIVESEAMPADDFCPNGGMEYKVRLMIGPDWSSCNDTGDTNTPCEPTINTRVEDHATGDYAITVTVGSDTATKTIKNVFVLNNPNNYRPKLISPREYPQWPGENATEAEMEAFHTAEMAFWEQGVSTFAPNNADSTALVDAVFKWEAPDLSALKLPETVGARYQVGINRFDVQDMDNDGDIDEDDKNLCFSSGWEQCNTEIYNTWWNNRAVKGTSFSLPVELAINEGEYSEYNVNVNLVFIDKETGREMAVGGNAFANFKVGTVEVLDDVADINFSGSISNVPTWVTAPKVALIAESNTYNETTGDWVWSTEAVAIADGNGSTYSLHTTAGEVKAKMAEKKGFNLILFDDVDEDGEWDPWTPDNQENSEAAWWMNNKWFWFENWGEFRISTDSESGGFESQKVTNDGVLVDGMNFAIEDFADETVESAETTGTTETAESSETAE